MTSSQRPMRTPSLGPFDTLNPDPPGIRIPTADIITQTDITDRRKTSGTTVEAILNPETNVQSPQETRVVILVGEVFATKMILKLLFVRQNRNGNKNDGNNLIS
jgi:hypothetical protein